MTITSELDLLNRQLALAQAKHTAAVACLRAAERKEDLADEKVNGIKAQIAALTIQSWGDKPDIAVLLQPRCSYVYYNYLSALASDMGLSVNGEWIDTKQTALSIAMSRHKAGAIELVASGIRLFSPYIRKAKGGWVKFGVSCHESDCAWELWYSPARGNCQLVKQVLCSAVERIELGTLELALGHIEQHLWADNTLDIEAHQVIDVPALEESMAH